MDKNTFVITLWSNEYWPVKMQDKYQLWEFSMLLESKDVINGPLDQVYPLVRDDLSKIVPYLPNVDKVEVVEEKRLSEEQLEKLNHWYAKAEVPSFAKKFIKPELFSWKDHAFWNDKEHLVNYELESFWANDLYDAKGTNYFKDLGDGTTELRVTCELVIHADKIPGVPKFLVKKVLPTVENMIEKMLGPNLMALGKGLNQYFKENS